MDKFYFDNTVSTNVTFTDNLNISLSNGSYTRINIPSENDIFFVELKLTYGTSSNGVNFGIGTGGSKTQYPGFYNTACGMNTHNGMFYYNASTASTSFRGVTGDTIALKFNRITNIITFYLNGVSIYERTNPVPITSASDVYFEIGTGSNGGASVRLYNDNKDFVYKNIYNASPYVNLDMYKTFILHNGEYKKFVNIPRTLENTIPIMTSNISPSGIASASSVYNKSVQYEAFKAFDNLNDSNGWISYDNSYPQWLSYEFAEPIIISKYSILCRIATPTASPKDWTFEGSNDGVTWYVLDTRVGFTDWVANIFNEFSFENNKEYSKYRIKISSNNGYASYSAISEMKMYKEIAPSQTFWESISTTLPTVEQFVSDGTSDLSILDRKPKTETIVMNDDVNSGAGEVLGDGMVFKKKIDLKKYFDITNLNIK